MKLSFFSYYWLAWAFLGFGIPEAYGLLRNVKDTLSWQFWGMEHLDFGHPFDFAQWNPLHYTLGIFLFLGLLWLFLHLVFGLIR